jgi:hypothetical protein
MTSTSEALISTYSALPGSANSSCSTCNDAMGTDVVGLGQGGRPQEASAAKGKEPSAGTSFIIRPSRCLEMVCETYLLQLRLVLREIRAHLGEGLRRLIVGHGAR